MEKSKVEYVPPEQVEGAEGLSNLGPRAWTRQAHCRPS